MMIRDPLTMLLGLVFLAIVLVAVWPDKPLRYLGMFMSGLLFTLYVVDMM